GGREGREAVEEARDLRVGVLVARVADGVALEEAACVGRVVVRVDPQEADALAELHGELLEERELGPAGAAPRGPLVHHHRVSLQRGKAGLEGGRAAAKELISL